MSNQTRIFGVLLSTALFAGASSAAFAATRGFTFRDVDYNSTYDFKNGREAQARAYVEAKMAPGTPMTTALAVAKQAGARCPKPSSDADGSVLCTADFSKHTSGWGPSTIQWRIRLVPGADGRSVAHASVERVVS